MRFATEERKHCPGHSFITERFGVEARKYCVLQKMHKSVLQAGCNYSPYLYSDFTSAWELRPHWSSHFPGGKRVQLPACGRPPPLLGEGGQGGAGCGVAAELLHPANIGLAAKLKSKFVSLVSLKSLSWRTWFQQLISSKIVHIWSMESQFKYFSSCHCWNVLQEKGKCLSVFPLPNSPLFAKFPLEIRL